MATLTSSLKLQDRFTRVMRAAYASTTKVIDAMERANATADKADLGRAYSEARRAIDAAEKELDQFEQGMKETDQQAGKTSRGISGWQKAIIVANQGLQLAQRLWSGLTSKMDTSDAIMSVNARLGLINDGLRTQRELQDGVRQAANASRGEYNATASLVSKVSQAELFATNDGAIKFAELLNKTMVISGATASEQQSAIIQLSQALASGVLQGDELRSLRENAPMLMKYLADGLGVSQGELKALGAEGELTAAKIAEAIMIMSDQIDADFTQMPMTFGQATTLIGNKIGTLWERLQQPGQAVDRIISKVMELVAWLNTDHGTAFLDSIASGVTAIVGGLMWLLQGAADVYSFISTNWSVIAPIIAGIAAAVVAWTIAQNAHTVALWAAATGQKALNAAMNANPFILIVSAIIAVITILITLWKTNADFRAGVIRIWNGVLGFFDQVPIFFTRIGFGIANAFDDAKVKVLTIVDTMVNGVISAINWLIEQLNKIPGVSIGAISEVGFAAAAQAEAEANRKRRDAELQGMVDKANEKAAAREAKLQEDIASWAADAESKSVTDSGIYDSGDYSTSTGTGASGSSSGGSGSSAAEKQIDLMEQQLKYLRDIAEQEVLSGFEALAAMETGLAISRSDAELLRQTAGQSNVFYLNYQGGGMQANANITQGESLDDIRRTLESEAQEEIDTGLSGLYELLPVP